MTVPCSKRHVLISEAIPRLHLPRALVLWARCEKQQASSSSREKKTRGETCVVDMKAPGINHSVLKACVMQSPTEWSRVSVINFPSGSMMLTQHEPEVLNPSATWARTSGTSSVY